jgi:hypothetical protein
MSDLVKGLLLIFSVTLSVSLGEWGLYGLGFPSELPVRAAHPPSYVETREFIEFRYRFATNREGLRYREIPRQRPAYGNRVLVLGDSYTEGLGVETVDRFTNHLELSFQEAGQEISFINGGLSGAAPSDYARLLKYVGLEYRPDGVLVCLFANEVGNTSEDPRTNPIDPPTPSRTGFKRYASRWWPRTYTLLGTVKTRWQYRRRTQTSDFVASVSSRARRQRIPEERIDAWSESLPSNIVAAINDGRFGFGVLSYGLLYPEFWTDSLDLDSERSEAKWKNMVDSLESIVSMVEREGIELAFVFLPVHFQYDPATHRPDHLAVRSGTLVRKEWLTADSEIEERLKRWAALRDIPFLSLTEAFREAISSKSALDYAWDGHWTPAGHHVAASALMEWLRDGKVFDFIAPAADVGPQ